jgi:hypothetical protein
VIQRFREIAGRSLKGIARRLCPGEFPTVEVVRLLPGDVLAVLFETELSAEQAERIRRHVGSILPEGVKVMVFCDGAKLAGIKWRNPQ